MDQNVKRLRTANGNLIEFGLTLGVYAVSVILPLTGKTAEPLPGRYSPLMPLGLTFAIWGAVYALLAVFCLYTLFPAIKRNHDRGAFIDRVGPLFILSCILNIGWMFAWRFGQVLAAAGFMGLLLITLAAIYLRLNVGVSRAARAERWLVHVPFSVYLGWVSVSTIASVTALLADSGAPGLEARLGTLAAVALTVFLAVFVLVKRGDILFSLVIALALAGMFLQHLLGAGMSDQVLITAAGAGAVMVAGAILYLMASGFKPKPNPARII